MQLNRFERWYVNQPLHQLTQRWWEAWPWQRMGADLRGHAVLELGCGQGQGQRILQKHFAAKSVDGLDFDPQQLTRARARNHGRSGLTWTQASACALPYANASFDSVVAFNALHHVPNWRGAVAEARRVLRPGGVFLMHETLRAFLQAPILRTLMQHPSKDRFDARDLRDELLAQGFTIHGERGVPACFRWVYARS